MDVAHTDSSADEAARPMDADVLRTLVDNHARFLSFLERRVGRREDAEEILQDAFVRGLNRGGDLRDEESAVAWFYRLLRNAIVDRHRHRDVERRAMQAAAVEPETPGLAQDHELMAEVCGCVGRLVDTLKPEYAEAIRTVELAGERVGTWAAASGLTTNNAHVRLHRARQALRRQIERSCGTCATHGCLDCHCTPRVEAQRNEPAPSGCAPTDGHAK